jgi:hypothetical protein
MKQQTLIVRERVRKERNNMIEKIWRFLITPIVDDDESDWEFIKRYFREFLP